MEYGWYFSIFGLKMMMKSGLGKIFLKFLHALTMSFYHWILFKSTNSVIKKITWLAHGGISKIFFIDLFIIIFRPDMLNFHPYSILTRDTRVELVIYICSLRIRNCSSTILKEKQENVHKWRSIISDDFQHLTTYIVVTIFKL